MNNDTTEREQLLDEIQAKKIAKAAQRRQTARNLCWILPIYLLIWIVSKMNQTVSDLLTKEYPDTFWLLAAVIVVYILWGFFSEPKAAKPPEENPVDKTGWLRFLVFVIIHATAIYLAYTNLDYYVYDMVSGKWYAFLRIPPDLLAVGLIGTSVWASWEGNKIEYYEKARLIIFGMVIAENVKPGLKCLGVPALVSFETMDTRAWNIVIGVIDKKPKKQFLLQGATYLVDVDVAVNTSPIDTAKYFKQGGGAQGEAAKAVIERKLVQFANAKINKEINRTDPVTGEKIYPTIESIIGAHETIALAVWSETGPMSLRAQFLSVGFVLHSLIIKDFTNPDLSVITAEQQMKAKAIYEKMEMMSLLNTIDKVHQMYTAWNKDGREIVTYNQCIAMVQRIEGAVQAYEVIGGQQQGGGRRGNRGGGGSQPLLYIDPRHGPPSDGGSA